MISFGNLLMNTVQFFTPIKMQDVRDILVPHQRHPVNTSKNLAHRAFTSQANSRLFTSLGPTTWLHLLLHFASNG